MIFILHYILLCGALPAVIVYLSIYLEKYSDASMSEIGTLLMAMPFLSILLKPLVCSLADRHQAHKQYLMGGLACMVLGYGSLAVAPFFPDFISTHGRLVWYMDIVSVLVGAGAFNIVYSLGDALAVNGAQMAGVSWGSYRMWALVSWGLFGALGSQVNELHELDVAPRYVPAIFLLVLMLTTEIVLLALWDDKYFVMYGNLKGKTARGDRAPEAETKEQERQQQVVVVAPVGRRDSVISARMQLDLLKFIAKRDRSFLGHLFVFAGVGFVINCHMIYFYMHVERQSRLAGPRFSIMTAGLMLMHSVFEIVGLLATPHLSSRLGRAPAVTLSVGGYFLLLLYHATYLTEAPLWLAIPLEGLHGQVTAAMYTLLNEVALEIVARLEGHLPELVERRLVTPDVRVLELKRSLRATMQGLLGGVLDGLGAGLGALAGGIFLHDNFNFSGLWTLCAGVLLLVTLAYPLGQWLWGAPRGRTKPRLDSLASVT